MDDLNSGTFYTIEVVTFPQYPDEFDDTEVVLLTSDAVDTEQYTCKNVTM